MNQHSGRREGRRPALRTVSKGVVAAQAIATQARRGASLSAGAMKNSFQALEGASNTALRGRSKSASVGSQGTADDLATAAAAAFIKASSAKVAAEEPRKESSAGELHVTDLSP
mmetsp:Transcript_2410/g.4039  ORF Transcript_2410/g.4039 Transcript_2410/m.4039 type:complete len:114 (-) Transcript_2410:65-406(-)